LSSTLIWVPSRDATLVLISTWAGNSAHSYLLLVSVTDSKPPHPTLGPPCLVDHQSTAPPPRERGLQPGSEPVCSDLTESLSAHNEPLSLQSKPCSAKAESGDHATNVGCAIADRLTGLDESGKTAEILVMAEGT
jgi:hypothetical protein